MNERIFPNYDYDEHGKGYSGYRQTDPRIAAYVSQALNSAETVLNVGAGAGSYEPADRYVAAVEPSEVMRRQREKSNKAPAVIGSAESLPFDDNAFDAVMAMVTIHHWGDMEKGLCELRRVARDRVVVLTFDPHALDSFWNVHYFPAVVEAERHRYPTLDFITHCLGKKNVIQAIPVPFDCTDGFQEAFYGRPEAFLNKDIRSAQSAWGFISDELEEHYVKNFAAELKSGAWDEKYGELRKTKTFTGALRLITASAD